MSFFPGKYNEFTSAESLRQVVENLQIPICVPEISVHLEFTLIELFGINLIKALLLHPGRLRTKENGTECFQGGAIQLVIGAKVLSNGLDQKMYPTLFRPRSDEEESLVDVVEWDERVYVQRLLVTFLPLGMSHTLTNFHVL